MEFNGTFFVSIISFIVFVYLMNKILYSPMQKMLMERREFIEGNYSSAECNNKKGKDLSAQRQEKILNAKNDARTKYNNTISEFKEQKKSIVEQAQIQANENLIQAYNTLENVSNETKEGLKAKMTDLANDIVEKVLGYRSEVQGFDNDTVNSILYH